MMNIRSSKKCELFEDYFRVTSIPFSNASIIIFTGMPLKRDSFKVNSGRYHITVKAHVNRLPVIPAIGQHWVVRGTRSIENLDKGDYTLKQHLYEEPEHVRCTLPETGEQLIKFIANEKDFRGIGESKARELWDALGRDFHQVAANDTQESRNRLRAILSEDSVDALFEGYAKYSNLRHANWMCKQGILSDVQQRLLKHHGEKSVQLIKSNPYLLINFGCSFDVVDSIAANFNVPNDSELRLSAALQISLRKEIEQGHTFACNNDLKPKLNSLLSDPDLVSKAFKAGFDKAQYILNHETGNYHPTAQLVMEKVVAKRLLSLSEVRNLYDENAEIAFREAESQLPYPLTQKQKLAVANSVDNAVSLITGGAGTGKTTVLRTSLIAKAALGFEIHAVALSGRASMRLHESIGFETSTIAKFLRNEPIEPSQASPFHVLVIDESSMIDLPTMYRIVNHIHPSVHIIFTGDPDQLPPIGCGKILSDLVESKRIVNTKLDIVKRQDGSTGIPEYSLLINRGKVPASLSTASIHFHETEANNIENVCCDLYAQSPANSRVVATTRQLVDKINTLVQTKINPDGEMMKFNMNGDSFFLKLRQNDQILFTQNHYDKGVQNGTLGTLTSVEQIEGSYGTITLDTGEKVEISASLLDCIQLGYAITLHKAQGSQFPRVIVALKKGRILDRAWLYTSITRAESEIHIVGSRQDFENAVIKESHSNKRRSYLSQILRLSDNEK